MTGGAGVGYLQVRPDLWMVERVEFEGVRHSGPGALRHLADLRNGTTIWSVDLEAASRGVERHPWVRSARASRKWPNTVTIAVEEYEPVAILHSDDLYYVDADGTPFLRGQVTDFDYPMITGLDPELERLHPDLPVLVIRGALSLADQLADTGLVDRSEISEVAFSEARGFTVHARRSRILFGLEGTGTQLDRLGMLVARGEVDLHEPLWIDLAPRDLAIVRPLERPGT